MALGESPDRLLGLAAGDLQPAAVDQTAALIDFFGDDFGQERFGSRKVLGVQGEVKGGVEVRRMVKCLGRRLGNRLGAGLGPRRDVANLAAWAVSPSFSAASAASRCP